VLCQKCGEEIPIGQNKCPNCGALLDGFKFCQCCGEIIDKDCVVCPKCGKQVAELKQQQPQVIINNSNNNTNVATAIATEPKKQKDKWVALCLCIFLGFFGAHKFYEEKFGLGVVYILTMGLFCIGWIADIFIILCKPNPYYV